AAAPVFFGNRDAEQIGLRELAPGDRIEPLAARLERLQAVVRDVIVQDRAGELAQRLLLGGKAEVHLVRPQYLVRGMASPAMAMMSRCTSFVPPPNVRIGAWPR